MILPGFYGPSMLKTCAKSSPKNQCNTNGPAQPACRKNVVADKFFAPCSTLGSWLISIVHQ